MADHETEILVGLQRVDDVLPGSMASEDSLGETAEVEYYFVASPIKPPGEAERGAKFLESLWEGTPGPRSLLDRLNS